MNTAVVWITREKAVVLVVEDSTLISRWTVNGGETWSVGKVEGSLPGVRNFTADYIPEEHRIRVLAWWDFRTDEKLGLLYIDDSGPEGT